MLSSSRRDRLCFTVGSPAPQPRPLRLPSPAACVAASCRPHLPCPASAPLSAGGGLRAPAAGEPCGPALGQPPRSAPAPVLPAAARPGCMPTARLRGMGHQRAAIRWCQTQRQAQAARARDKLYARAGPSQQGSAAPVGQLVRVDVTEHVLGFCPGLDPPAASAGSSAWGS